MKTGTFDRKIDIQRKAVTQSASGEQQVTWNFLASYRWASYRPLKGDERFVEPQFSAEQQVEFKVRWSTDIADLTPLDRIVYPSVFNNSPQTVPEINIFDILGVSEINRREGLSIIAIRRTEL